MNSVYVKIHFCCRATRKRVRHRKSDMDKFVIYNSIRILYVCTHTYISIYLSISISVYITCVCCATRKRVRHRKSDMDEFVAFNHPPKREEPAALKNGSTNHSNRSSHRVRLCSIHICHSGTGLNLIRVNPSRKVLDPAALKNGSTNHSNQSSHRVRI